MRVVALEKKRRDASVRSLNIFVAHTISISQLRISCCCFCYWIYLHEHTADCVNKASSYIFSNRTVLLGARESERDWIFPLILTNPLFAIAVFPMSNFYILFFLVPIYELCVEYYVLKAKLRVVRGKEGRRIMYWIRDRIIVSYAYMFWKCNADEQRNCISSGKYTNRL